MLLSGALFALFMMGFWLYCLTDAILTPASECRGLAKPAWIAVIALTFIGGAIAWLIAREPLRRTYGSPASAPRWDPDAPGDPDDLGDGYFRNERWTTADDAVARHPAGRGRPAGRQPGHGPRARTTTRSSSARWAAPSAVTRRPAGLKSPRPPGRLRVPRT